MAEKKVVQFDELHPETTLEWLTYYLLKEVSLLRKDINAVMAQNKKGK